jgi:hypothetical protein
MIGEFAIGAVFFAVSYWVLKFAERAAIIILVIFTTY